MQHDVGVIIPTFNRPLETKRALDSVFNQTFPPQQIVIIDDGSDAESLAKLQDLISDLPVTLIKTEHTGHPGIARNVGLNALNTKWVAFLDSDDAWISNKLETQLDFAEKYKAKALCGNAALGGNEKRDNYFVGTKNSKFSLNNLLADNRVITSSVFVDRELLLSVDGIATSFSSRGAEDYATWLRIATLTKWFYIGKPISIYYNDSPDSFRTTGGFSQNYVRYFGLLDFQSWLESKGNSRTWLVRLYLKGLSIIMNISMKLK